MVTTLGAAGAAAAMALLVRVLIGRSQARGVLLVLALVAVSFFGGPTVPDGLRSTALLVTVTFLAVALPRARPEQRWDARGVLLVVLYGGSVAVTALASPATVSAVVWVAGVAILATVVAIRCGARDRATFLTGLVGLAVVQSILAAYEFFVAGRPVFWDYTTAEGSPGALPNPLLGSAAARVTGTMAHPILLATLLAVGAIVVLATPRLRSSVRWGLVATLLGGIVLSGTRSALIALLLAALVLLFTSSRRGRAPRIVFGLGLGGAALAVSLGDLLAATEELLGSGSFTNRSSALDSAPALFMRPVVEMLFGSGFGSEPALRERGFLAQNGFDVVDNQLVTSLATQGLFGLLVVIALLIAWFRHGDRLQRALTVAMGVFFFTFDDLRWPAVIVLLVPLLTMRGTPTQTEPSLAVPAVDEPAIARTTTDVFVPALRPRSTERIESRP